MDFNNKGILTQLEAGRKIWDQNNSLNLPATNMMMITPNGTFFSHRVKFDLLYNIGGEAHFKQRTLSGGYAKFQARGYLNTETRDFESEKWHKISANGREISLNPEPSADLQILELMTKRIRTIELAREIWIQKYSRELMSSLNNNKKLGIEFGYDGWPADKIYRRTAFLYEYSRRIETTHLKSIDNLVVKLESKGELFNRSPSHILYRAPLNHYLLGLKSRYSNKQMQVREMNDLQYYVWILKNGKL
jgi:hypothetical protein